MYFCCSSETRKQLTDVHSEHYDLLKAVVDRSSFSLLSKMGAHMTLDGHADLWEASRTRYGHKELHARPQELLMRFFTWRCR